MPFSRKLKAPGRRTQSTAGSLAAGAADKAEREEDESISVSNLSLHELFDQQTREVLERADLDDEQKQSILVALSCPCCGAGGMSYTVKLKR